MFTLKLIIGGEIKTISCRDYEYLLKIMNIKGGEIK